MLTVKGIEFFPTKHDDYHVSKCGKIVSTKGRSPRLMRVSLNHGGYPHVSMCSQNKHFTRPIHRLIAETFLPNQKETVNHINGIKTDNRLENLEWATVLENTRHAIVTGLIPPSYKNKPVLDTLTGIFYTNIKEAAYAKGIPHSTARARLNGFRKNTTSLIAI